MKCFTTDFFTIFWHKCQNFLFGWSAGYSTTNPRLAIKSKKLAYFLLNLQTSRENNLRIIQSQYAVV